MRRHSALAFLILAAAGCGGDDDPGPRAAPAATAAGAADLACVDHVGYFLEDVAAGDDPAATVRTLFEDELERFDTVEVVDGGVRVVRGGRVVAVARTAGGKIERVDACESFSR